MVDAPISVQHPLFIARADWRDDTNYPNPEVHDSSIWAWELLRRNGEYARDYEICKDACLDVPPTPYPMDPLTHYLCEPDPIDPNMLYRDYARRHRNHFVYPIKDAVRRKWQINDMPDPGSSWTELLKQHRDRGPDATLAWLFACNTVDVINPPDRWTQRSHLLASKVTGVCVENEVLVRLDLTGNLDEQIESLRRQVAGFFKGGNRSGGLLVGEYRDLSRCRTAKYDSQLRSAVDSRTGRASWPLPHYAPVLPSSPDWSNIPARQKSLHYVLRMADAIASAEQGILADQLRERRIDTTYIGVTAEQAKIIEQWTPSERRLHYPAMCEELFPSIAKALAKYFSRHPFPDDTRDADYKTISRWLSLAGDLIASHEYALIARMNTLKSKARNQQRTTAK